MADATSTPPVVRFGAFEVDLQAGELRKKGFKVRLQEQPLQVLALLLEQPGHVVTREELRQKLWGGTVVDFEHSINTTINKLRDSIAGDIPAARTAISIPGPGGPPSPCGRC